MNKKDTKKTILITGSSSGFGRLTARLFQKRGWNVIATMRSPEKETELVKLDNVMVTKLDVTDSKTIKSAVQQGIENFGSIDALLNNAGYGAFGYLEEASEEEVRSQMETNFFGVVQVIQEVLPHMRAQRSGVIINITSIAGLAGMPMLSLYCASKFAVEGLSESLNHELKAFNIKVKTIAPGAFDTGFAGAHTFNSGAERSELDGYRERYKEFLSKIITKPPKPFGFGDPKDVAEAIYRSVVYEKSPWRNLVGKDAKLLLFIKRLLPGKIFFTMLNSSAMPKFRGMQ